MHVKIVKRFKLCGDYLINPVNIGVIIILISIAKLIEREAVEISSSVNALPLLRFFAIIDFSNVFENN